SLVPPLPAPPPRGGRECCHRQSLKLVWGTCRGACDKLAELPPPSRGRVGERGREYGACASPFSVTLGLGPRLRTVHDGHGVRYHHRCPSTHVGLHRQDQVRADKVKIGA